MFTIITVRFICSQAPAKHYDYLLRNPGMISINKKDPYWLVNPKNPQKSAYVYVTKTKQIRELPPHVTAGLTAVPYRQLVRFSF